MYSSDILRDGNVKHLSTDVLDGLRRLCLGSPAKRNRRQFLSLSAEFQSSCGRILAAEWPRQGQTKRHRERVSSAWMALAGVGSEAHRNRLRLDRSGAGSRIRRPAGFIPTTPILPEAALRGSYRATSCSSPQHSAPCAIKTSFAHFFRCRLVCRRWPCGVQTHLHRPNTPICLLSKDGMVPKPSQL